LPPFELFGQKRRGIVRGRVLQARFLRAESLDENVAASRPPSAAPGELSDERERSLLGAKVGESQRRVRVLHDGKRDFGEVVSLRDHLGADEDPGLRALEAIENAGDPVLSLGGIGVEPEDRERIERVAKLGFEPLGAGAVARNSR
jgi:hypothetical protein